MSGIFNMNLNKKPIEKNDEFQCDHCDVAFKTRNGLKMLEKLTSTLPNPLRSYVDQLLIFTWLSPISKQP